MTRLLGYVGSALIGALLGNFLLGGILNTIRMGKGDTPGMVTVELAGGAALMAAVYAIGIRSRRSDDH